MTEQTDANGSSDRFQEGDVVEVWERWAFRNNTTLKQVVESWMPSREEYVLREFGGTEHHKSSAAAIRQRITPIQDRKSNDLDYLHAESE